MVPCDDGAALADGIEHVIRNPGLQRTMLRQGLARIDKDFSEAAVIAQYRALMRNCWTIAEMNKGINIPHVPSGG